MSLLALTLHLFIGNKSYQPLRLRLHPLMIVFVCSFIFSHGALAQNASLFFDGIDDVASADINLPGDYTFEFLIQFQDLQQGEETIFSMGGAQRTPWLGTDSAIGNRLSFWDGEELFVTDASFEIGTWYHIALVKQNNRILLFIDGIQEVDVSVNTTAPSGTLFWGSQGNSNAGSFIIDELRISNVARYVDNAYLLSDCNFNFDLSTYALYHFSEASTFQFATDFSGNGREMTLGASSAIEDSDPEWIELCDRCINLGGALSGIMCETPEVELFVPNAFTPNEDGINDVYFISGVGIQSMELLVFTRWGNLVGFFTNPNSGWNGKFVNGKKAPEGTYTFKLTVQFENGTETSRSGTLMLAR